MQLRFWGALYWEEIWPYFDRPLSFSRIPFCKLYELHYESHETPIRTTSIRSILCRSNLPYAQVFHHDSKQRDAIQYRAYATLIVIRFHKF
jgi:hypothetical protein